MRFYRIFPNTIGNYARACGYGPLAAMPFVDSMTEEFKAKRLRFWNINPSPPGMEIDPGYSLWPDCIGITLGNPHECFSGRVIEDLEQARFSIWRKTEMPVAKIGSKRLLGEPRPDYYVLEAEPGIDVDYSVFGLPLDEDGYPLGNSYRPSEMGPPPVRLSSWSGEHLVSLVRSHPMNFICTEFVKDLCEEKGWTNFGFKEMPVVP